MLLHNHTMDRKLFVHLSIDLLCVITIFLVSLPYKEGTFSYICIQIFGNHSIVLTDKMDQIICQMLLLLSSVISKD